MVTGLALVYYNGDTGRARRRVDKVTPDDPDDAVTTETTSSSPTHSGRYLPLFSPLAFPPPALSPLSPSLPPTPSLHLRLLPSLSFLPPSFCLLRPPSSLRPARLRIDVACFGGRFASPISGPFARVLSRSFAPLRPPPPRPLFFLLVFALLVFALSHSRSFLYRSLLRTITRIRCSAGSFSVAPSLAPSPVLRALASTLARKDGRHTEPRTCIFAARPHARGGFPATVALTITARFPNGPARRRAEATWRRRRGRCRCAGSTLARRS